MGYLIHFARKWKQDSKEKSLKEDGIELKFAYSDVFDDKLIKQYKVKLGNQLRRIKMCKELSIKLSNDVREANLSVPPITGINLENYFPSKCTYDSVIYVHKKFLPQSKNKPQKVQEAPDVKKTRNKCQQFDSEIIKTDSYKVRKIVKDNVHKDPVVEQTIRFAETIIPLTIPASTDTSPHQEYTIKAMKKSKKKSTNTNQQKTESMKDVTYEMEKHNTLVDHMKREKLKRQRDNIIARDTISSSQNNTLDDINENRTLSCTLSEISERKDHKEGRHCKRNKRNEIQKVAVSESFEAVATEFMNTSSDTKIKIHLMNERDKNLFCENIQTPVIGALKECIVNLNEENLKVLRCMQTTIERQTKKIDVILSKMTSFEEKLNFYMKERTSAMVTKTSIAKTLKLEELGADIIQVKETTSDEEELVEIDLTNKSTKDERVKVIKSIDENVFKRQKKAENLGCGEDVPAKIKAQQEVKPDRPNRVPARFCWTDTSRKN